MIYSFEGFGFLDLDQIIACGSTSTPNKEDPTETIGVVYHLRCGLSFNVSYATEEGRAIETARIEKYLKNKEIEKTPKVRSVENSI